MAEPLTTTLKIDNEIKIVDTTIPTMTIKNIYNYGGKGKFNTAVCLEGGNSSRKEYFSKQTGEIGAKDKSGYKGNRSRQRNSFYEGIDTTIELLLNSGVSLYRANGCEADDCIAALVNEIKESEDDYLIDIITNDADLLPFVDDKVSVYMRGTRQFSEDGSPEHRLYYQVTPDSWNDFVSYASAFKGFFIPYNSMLLFKLMRGDKADNIAGAVKGYGGAKYSALMSEMLEDGINFESTFRYGVDFDSVIGTALCNYFSDDVIEYMKYIYNGINPIPLSIKNLPKQIDVGLLQKNVSPLKIHLIR